MVGEKPMKMTTEALNRLSGHVRWVLVLYSVGGHWTGVGSWEVNMMNAIGEAKIGNTKNTITFVLSSSSSFNCYIVMVRTKPLTIVIKLGVVHLPQGC